MKIFITTDTHFGHEKMSTMYRRPEGYSEMLINSLKEKGGDILFHLGDICIGNDEYWMQELMKASSRFKRRILIRGNHDNKSYNWYLKRGFDHVCEFMYGKYFGKKILLSHMMIKDGLSLTSYYHPDIHIHGHFHGGCHRSERNEIYDKGYHYDVAPELHNYQIVDMQKIIQKTEQWQRKRMTS